MGGGSWRLSCSAVISCTNQRPISKTRKHAHRRQARTKARTKGAQKHDRRHRKQKSTRAREHESTRAREHKSTRAQEQRNTSEPKASESLCALITAAQRHYPGSSTDRERARTERKGGVLNHRRAASSCCPARRRTRSDSRTGVTRCPCIRHVKRRRRHAYLGHGRPARSRDLGM